MRKKIVLLITLLFFGISLNAQDKPQKWSGPQPMWAYDFSNTNHTPFIPIAEQQVHQKNTPTYYNSPFGVLAVNPSFSVLPRSNSWQSEVILVRHPINPLIMFGSSNAFNNVGGPLFISEGVYVTTNGGASWFGSDTLTGAPISNHGGDPGPTIDKDGNFIESHLGFTTSGMYANYSTDNGLTWSANFTIQAGSVDKNLCGTDDAPSSPFYGRSYTVWTTFSGTYPDEISYTTNHGVTWSAPSTMIPPTSGRICRAEDLRVGPNGEVYVTWTPNIGSNPEDQCAFAKSTDGGVTFTGTQNAFAMSGLLIFNGGFGSYNIRMNSFPRIDVDRSGGPRNGWIYIVVSQKNLAPAGTDPDIVLHRSTDGGTTWSAGIRVNQDALNNGKYQFFNAIRVDEFGGVNVIYYDNRNTSADSAECFVSRSIDGGTTWTDIPVSGHRFKPKPITVGGIAGGYSGDYIGITSGNNKVWPFWMDDISGTFQAWTAAIDLGPSINHTPLTNTEQISGSRPVNCTINPAGSGINPGLTKLFYAKNSTSFTGVALTNSSGNNWTANLPLTGAGTYNYYITTTDSLNRTATAPAGAPGFYYSFVSSTDTVKPVILTTPIGNTPKQSWPVTVSATVTDNIGVDSVWVRWYRNTISNYREFKLINSSGNVFSALFNSVNSEVTPGDTIKYRIIAQDISTAHNRDSTALYSFAITNLVSNYICRVVWVPIRDNTTNYDSFQVTTHSSIIRVNFTMVELIHTYDGDVTFALRSPAGTEVTLSANHGAGGDNYINTVFNDSATTPISSGVAPFTGTFLPDNALSAFNGQDSYGWWRLRVNDNASADTGHVGQYCVQIYSGSTVTGIRNNGNIPNVFSLAQNYPNPFNPVTRINFSIPKQGLVNLKIYDVLGREIKSLVNEVKAPGEYSVDFNGTEFSSGVYFYKLESNGFTDIKKMMLIK